MQQKSKFECACKECKACCWRSPGWFGTIEEIEGAAKIKNLSINEFCRRYLIQEWWAGENEDISIPAPRKNFTRRLNDTPDTLRGEKRKNGKGFVRATWAHNLITGFACIFLTKNERCAIHGSKPAECRDTFACKTAHNNYSRESLIPYWKAHQHLLPISKETE